MQFNKSIQEGYAKKVLIDNIRAKSLIKTADNALLSAKELQMIERNYNSILRNYTNH